MFFDGTNCIYKLTTGKIVHIFNIFENRARESEGGASDIWLQEKHLLIFLACLVSCCAVVMTVKLG